MTGAAIRADGLIWHREDAFSLYTSSTITWNPIHNTACGD